MNHGPIVFLSAFLALSASWFGFVLAPQIQIGRMQQGTSAVNTAELYPEQRPGMARQGEQIYRADGCVYCHSQSVRQTGTLAEVYLREAGTNLSAVVAALGKISEGPVNANAAGIAGGLPKVVLQTAQIQDAVALAKALTTAGAKADTHVVPTGPDIAWGWGLRGSVAQDYVFDLPVMVGSQRIGPDLANIASRKPDANWQLVHLYAPQAVVKDSVMPPYRFLFRTRKISGAGSPDALKLPPEVALPAGYEVVPTPQALQLVAYLLSLRSETPLFEAPLTIATASTNAPAK